MNPHWFPSPLGRSSVDSGFSLESQVQVTINFSLVTQAHPEACKFRNRDFKLKPQPEQLDFELESNHAHGWVGTGMYGGRGLFGGPGAQTVLIKKYRPKLGQVK